MVKQVIWSFRAQRERKEILRYWLQRNKSNLYSRKLNKLFKEAVQLIREHPYIGRPTNDPAVRIKIVKDYLLIYEISDERISILSIWDWRQDPQKIGDIIK